MHRIVDGNREYDDISEVKLKEDVDDDEEDYFAVDEQFVFIFAKQLSSFSCIEEHDVNNIMPSVISVFGMVKFENRDLLFNIYVYDENLMVEEHLKVCISDH